MTSVNFLYKYCLFISRKCVAVVWILYYSNCWANISHSKVLCPCVHYTPGTATRNPNLEVCTCTCSASCGVSPFVVIVNRLLFTIVLGRNFQDNPRHFVRGSFLSRELFASRVICLGGEVFFSEDFSPGGFNENF